LTCQFRHYLDTLFLVLARKIGIAGCEVICAKSLGCSDLTFGGHLAGVIVRTSLQERPEAADRREAMPEAV